MELYQHNKEAYDKIQTMFQREDRVAIIHATGTGKSFISLQWLYDNRDKKCLFLAPTYEILDQLERHMQSQGLSLKTFPNLKCMIYDNLARLSVQTLNRLHVDNIVLDEFHRCGAPTWGKAVNTVFQNNPTAKVLGITATPVRYLDNQRNMAQEIFNGNIASEISLSDAIADGILPMPKYISAVYSFDEDLQRIENKINQVQNSKDKDILQKDLEEAKRNLEKSEGLPEIFAKHLPVRNGKYIVFCKDFAHMQRMMQEAHGWLKDINPNLDIYSVYSGQSRETNERNLERFENFQNDHIKLLFSIEMLNEGVHVNDVDGVIMLRPTNSLIIYLQQLGRALSAGHKEHPIIFDIVNNINANKIIYDVYQEVKEKISDRTRNRNKKVNLADFKIIDELKGPSDFIEALDDLLDRETINSYNFESKFQELINFVVTHDGQMPNKRSEDKHERSLCAFHRDYRHDFTPEQEQQLNEVRVIKARVNEDRFDDLFDFVSNNDGKLPSKQTKDRYEKSLHNFYEYYKHDFSPEQNERLNAVRRKQEKKSFNERFEDLVEYVATNAGQIPRPNSENHNERLLGNYYRDHKFDFTPEQKQRLIAAGAMADRLEAKKHLSVDDLVEFVETHDGNLPRLSSKDQNEQALYRFYYTHQNNFSLEQKQRLIAVGFFKEKKATKSFGDRFEDLIEFVVTHDGKMPSRCSKDAYERLLGHFYQKHAKGKHDLTAEQIQRLNEVRVIVNRFDDLVKFIFNHNGRIPSTYSQDPNEHLLGIYYYNCKKKITVEQKQRLIAAGVPAEKLEKKTKCTIDPADGKRVLKQRQKDDLQNGGLTQ